MRAPSQGGFLISQIHELSKQIFTEMLQQHQINLKSNQGRIIFILWEEDQIPISKIKAKTGLTKTTLSSVLKKMEVDNLIELSESTTDRREKIVQLTAVTKQKNDIFLAISQKMTDITYIDFKKQEIEQFEAYLKRILSNLHNFKS